ncbi:asparaginyl-tRNA synthetase [Lindgomyces ingoldianus]|uniref:Asparaginyl-tRNA synthetase n=1 Tax=Lindgomyces ingoldianus TaxID=673940 RepID=A0ACB6RFC5_9PLEO|nr:asparaginyl-tRNA synthetase [Lindgomyces ingoldianus]KAF2477944.1 asparaginyl-tRNA synthetase [Lindgomyces ingoldianus]
MADPTYYIDEDVGVDSKAQTGTEDLPYKTLGFAVLTHGETAKFLTRKSLSGDVPEGSDATSRLEWKPVAKAAMKKAINYAKAQQKKAAREQELLAMRMKEEADRKKVLDEAKKIIIKEDTSLPHAERIKLDETDPAKVKLGNGSDVKGTRVRVFGRVHRERRQKEVMFITLRDGYGFMQVIFTGPLAKTYDALTLTRETSMEILGELKEVPPGAHAPNNRELHADYFKIHAGCKAAGGDDAITNRVSKDTEHATLLDLRHLTLRGENASKVLIVRDAVEYAFNIVYKELRMRKVSPPALVQTQVEGGATLFKFNYYHEEAYLTQSSQLYLETCLPSMGDVYCIEKSFRAEKSLTRRHLAEYSHVEAELDFITFDDLLEHLELVMCRVLEVTMSDPTVKQYIMDLNPEFQIPERPFKRMKYTEAIDWLVEHGILNEDNEPHKFGDDIAEAAERKMTDIINRPIFLTHFPAEIKAFYMPKDKDDPRVTESVDCLMPGVGEIVGGSMRIYDYDELIAAFKRVDIDPAPYYWYTDQRKYGSSPHGGYGLGLERFLAWLCKQHTVRDCCLYPRYFGRCKP